jgi:hypothetical protein
MRILEELFPEFTQKLDEIDQLCSEKRVIDERNLEKIILPAVVQEMKSKFININCLQE